MTSILTIVFIVFFVLSVLNFVYCGIILPSVRLHFRFRLFAIRDRLRTLAAVPGAIDKEQFDLLHDLVNGSISVIPFLDLQAMSTWETRIKFDRALRERIDSRLRRLDKCKHPEFQDIRRINTRVLTLALFANTGPWFFYLVPFALVVIFVGKLKRFVRDMACIRESELSEFAPSMTPAST